MHKTAWAGMIVAAIGVGMAQVGYVESSTGFRDNPVLEGGRTELEFADINNDGNIDILCIGDHGSPYINTDEHGAMAGLTGLCFSTVISDTAGSQSVMSTTTVTGTSATECTITTPEPTLATSCWRWHLAMVQAECGSRGMIRWLRRVRTGECSLLTSRI